MVEVIFDIKLSYFPIDSSEDSEISASFEKIDPVDIINPVASDIINSPPSDIPSGTLLEPSLVDLSPSKLCDNSSLDVQESRTNTGVIESPYFQVEVSAKEVEVSAKEVEVSAKEVEVSAKEVEVSAKEVEVCAKEVECSESVKGQVECAKATEANPSSCNVDSAAI